MKNSKEAGEWKTMKYKGKQEKKSQHCWTGFFSEKANLVPLQKQQRTVHYDTRMHRLG